MPVGTNANRTRAKNIVVVFICFLLKPFELSWCDWSRNESAVPTPTATALIGDFVLAEPCSFRERHTAPRYVLSDSLGLGKYYEKDGVGVNQTTTRLVNRLPAQLAPIQENSIVLPAETKIVGSTWSFCRPT